MHSYYKRSFKLFWLLLYQLSSWTRYVHRYHSFGFHILIIQRACLYSISILQFWFTLLLQFHFVTTCHSLRRLYVQLGCWHTWGNSHLNVLLLICTRMEYLLNFYVKRSWYFVCAVDLAKIAYWYKILCHIIPTPPSNGFVNFYLYFILLICMSIAYSLNFYVKRSWYIFLRVIWWKYLIDVNHLSI